jgi:hypothetical protein
LRLFFVFILLNLLLVRGAHFITVSQRIQLQNQGPVLVHRDLSGRCLVGGVVVHVRGDEGGGEEMHEL